MCRRESMAIPADEIEGSHKFADIWAITHLQLLREDKTMYLMFFYPTKCPRRALFWRLQARSIICTVDNSGKWFPWYFLDWITGASSKWGICQKFRSCNFRRAASKQVSFAIDALLRMLCALVVNAPMTSSKYASYCWNYAFCRLLGFCNWIQFSGIWK